MARKHGIGRQMIDLIKAAYRDNMTFADRYAEREYLCQQSGAKPTRIQLQTVAEWDRQARYELADVDRTVTSPVASNRWLRYLERFAPHRETCLFAVAPDVFGDGPATLARSLPVLARIRDVGLPVALVLQPGIIASEIPWDDIDAVFTGGPDTWQRSETVQQIVDEAGRRGKHRHRGRVNSRRRFVASAVQGYDSCDGTYIAYNPDELTERVAGWVGAVRSQLPLPSVS